MCMNQFFSHVLVMLFQVNSGVTVEGTDCDVSNPASVVRLVSHAQAKLGRIDVWINNAGYSGSFQVLPGMMPFPSFDPGLCTVCVKLTHTQHCSLVLPFTT